MSESTGTPRDPRLLPLFEDDAAIWTPTCLALVEHIFEDPELEQQMIEVVQEALDQDEGFSSGEICCVLLLGETRSAPSSEVLIQCLQQDDEILQRISTRSLQRIGSPAFERIFDLLDDPQLDGEVAALAVECLEGISLHDLPHSREQIEDRLRSDLTRSDLPVQRKEASALALAHLGVQEAVDVIELVLDRDFPRGNVFILEALEILAEHPDGIPGCAIDPIEHVVRWLGDESLPGGDLDAELLMDLEQEQEQEQEQE